VIILATAIAEINVCLGFLVEERLFGAIIDEPVFTTGDALSEG
jgi:hypothetical protein